MIPTILKQVSHCPAVCVADTTEGPFDAVKSSEIGHNIQFIVVPFFFFDRYVINGTVRNNTKLICSNVTQSTLRQALDMTERAQRVQRVPNAEVAHSAPYSTVAAC